MTTETTDDAVLGGRLRLLQPKRGHRVGHDAILLAAATAAEAGEHAIDLGAGIGGAGLALAQRVPGLRVTLVEIEADLCALAAENARRNGMADRVHALAADVAELPLAPLQTGCAERVLMNPPFNDPRAHQVSPDPRRRRAHAADPGLLARWAGVAHRLLEPQGVLTLIWRADGLHAVLDALLPEFGDAAVLPVLPREHAAPIRVLVRAVKGAPWTRRDFAALVLNDAAGKPSAQAEAVLRGGAALPLARTD
jgi:tRNA1(Val) A37 N6-methylase TrmN6